MEVKPENVGGKGQQDHDIRETLEKVKNKIIVMSGKGGVGKSSVAVNIAVGLANSGNRVGLMDVDLHGPSIPQMLGLPGLKESVAEQADGTPRQGVTFWDNKIIPALFSGNLLVVSIESMIEDIDTAVIWRGPRKISAIRQFIADVQWGELDYLIIDSPPGTGDEPLTVAQTIPDARAVIVTTPQAVSVRDVRKSIDFCKKVNMEILGLVENMSGFTCPSCGKQIDLFKTGGGVETARETGVRFLGKIPIVPDVVIACDNGVPAINSSEVFKEAVEKILDDVTGKEKNAQKEILPKTEKGEGLLKIAIPVAQSKLAMHFGHCEEFALIDVDENKKKILKHETVQSPEHQPGLLPKWLNEQGANMIIAGGMGSRAQSLFTDNDIKVVIGAPAEEPEKIVASYLEGNLATGSNICDH